MRVFIDTSAIFALLSSTDKMHRQAARAFSRLRGQEAILVTSSYVIVETYALVSNRLGLEAAGTFRERFAPLLEVRWVDVDLHEQALDQWLKQSRRKLSLVDVTSFVIAQQEKITDVFAYDKHFHEAGFSIC